RPGVEIGDGTLTEPPSGTLVDHRGIDVPVAEHHGTLLERGTDDLVDVLGSSSGVEQGFGPVAHLLRFTRQHHLTYALPDRRAARLACDQRVPACAFHR